MNNMTYATHTYLRTTITNNQICNSEQVVDTDNIEWLLPIVVTYIRLFYTTGDGWITTAQHHVYEEAHSGNGVQYCKDKEWHFKCEGFAQKIP